MNVELIVVWFLWFVFLGALALPAASLLLSPLELEGAGFAVPFGASVVTLVAFWTGHLAFGTANAVLGVVVLAGLSALALRSGTDVSLDRYGEATVAFGVAFALAVGVRALTPQLHVWAEGYLNYGLVKTILRSGSMPPEDMWFAGYPVQYHYGGHFALSTWALLTNTPARYLPNIGLAGFYAMLLTGAYELAGTVGARRGAPRRVAGAAGAFMLGVASNLYPPLRLLVGALPEAVAAPVRSTLSMSPRRLGGEFNVLEATRFGFTNTDFPLYSLWIQSFHGHVMSQPFTLLATGLLCAYFLTPAENRRGRLARLAAATAVVGVVAFTNVWSLPMGAGLAALAVAFAPAHPATLLPERVRPDLEGAVRRETSRYAGGLVAGVVVVGGAMVAVAPFFLATDATRPPGVLPDRSGVEWFVVGYGAFLAAFALFLAPRIRESVENLRVPAALVGTLAVVAVALDFFALAFVGPALLGGWWLLRRSDAVGFETLLVVAGAGLAMLVELVYVRGGAEPGRLNTAYKVYSQVWLCWSVAAGATLATVAADALPDLDGPTAGAVTGSGVLPDGGTPDAGDSDGSGDAPDAGDSDGSGDAPDAGDSDGSGDAPDAGDSDGSRDVPDAGDSDGSRDVPDAGDSDGSGDPTGEGSPDGAADSRDAGVGPAGTIRIPGGPPEGVRIRDLATLFVVGLLVVSVSLYAGFAVEKYVREDYSAGEGPSMDAMRFLDVYHDDQAGAIRWLDDREGQPRVLVAVPREGDLYRFNASAPPSLTGLPTVAGYSHAADYHSESAYRRRTRFVRRAYEGSDRARAIVLAHYGIDYVYVGPYERSRYDVADLASQPGIEPVHRSGAVTIYAVDESALGAGNATGGRR